MRKVTVISQTSIGIGGRYHFLLRRLHSLTGLVPIGVFLCEHLFTNSQILMGNEHFVHDVQFIRGLPAIYFMELFGIWLPLAFHGVLGCLYVFVGAKSNMTSYPYMSNVRYLLQRVTGIIALLFIALHLVTVQWGIAIGSWYTPFAKEVPEDMVVSMAYAIQFSWWTEAMYFIGVVCAVYHFANGLWTMAITWGLTVTVGAQKRWAVVCLLVGLGLGAAGIGAGVKFSMIEVGDYRPDKDGVKVNCVDRDSNEVAGIQRQD